jgi:hypothetical protein
MKLQKKAFSWNTKILLQVILKPSWERTIWQPLFVDDVDPEFVVRSVDWFEKLVNIDNNLGAGSFALLEIMQKVNQS